MKGQVYSIKSHQTTDIYVGSTIIPLKIRFSVHKNKSKTKKTSASEMFKYEDVYIELIEEIECNSLKELHSRERYYIENMNCINKNIPTRTQPEYREANKEKIQKINKQYYIDNKEKINNQCKKYREENREKLQEYNKKYREENREYDLERKKKK